VIIKLYSGGRIAKYRLADGVTKAATHVEYGEAEGVTYEASGLGVHDGSHHRHDRLGSIRIRDSGLDGECSADSNSYGRSSRDRNAQQQRGRSPSRRNASFVDPHA
jgi:hypothetical protein